MSPDDLWDMSAEQMDDCREWAKKKGVTFA